MNIDRLAVSDVMHRVVYCARPEMTVRELIKELVSRRIRGCPVLDDQEHLVGEISLSDVAVGLGFPPEGLTEPTVSDLMVRNVLGLEQTAPLSAALVLFHKHRVHRLVITYQGRVVGILTPFDLLPGKERSSVLL